MILLTRLHDLMVLQAQATPSAADGAGPGGPFGTIALLVLMFLVIYLMMIRPASKQRREHAAMLNALKKDDEVVTTGGILGRIYSIEDKIATIEIADRVKIRVLRDRIAGRWSPSANNASAISSSEKK